MILKRTLRSKTIAKTKTSTGNLNISTNEEDKSKTKKKDNPLSNKTPSSVVIDLRNFFEDGDDNIDYSKPLELKTCLVPYSSDSGKTFDKFISYTYKLLPAPDKDMLETPRNKKVYAKRPLAKYRNYWSVSKHQAKLIDAILHDNLITTLIKGGKQAKFKIGKHDSHINGSAKSNFRCRLYETKVNIMYPNTTWIMESASHFATPSNVDTQSKDINSTFHNDLNNTIDKNVPLNESASHFATPSNVKTQSKGINSTSHNNVNNTNDKNVPLNELEEQSLDTTTEIKINMISFDEQYKLILKQQDEIVQKWNNILDGVLIDNHLNYAKMFHIDTPNRENTVHSTTHLNSSGTCSISLEESQNNCSNTQTSTNSKTFLKPSSVNDNVTTPKVMNYKCKECYVYLKRIPYSKLVCFTQQGKGTNENSSCSSESSNDTIEMKDYVPLRRSKRRLGMYLSTSTAQLDGINDSSSSSDTSTHPQDSEPCKRIRKRRNAIDAVLANVNSPKFPALDMIEVQSKAAKRSTPTTPTVRRSIRIKNRTPARERTTAILNTSLSCTLIEEKVVCNFKPSVAVERSAISVLYHSQENLAAKNFKKMENDIELCSSPEICNESLDEKQKLSQTDLSYRKNNDVENNFKLTVAQKYDLKNEISPQEGSSRKFEVHFLETDSNRDSVRSNSLILTASLGLNQYEQKLTTFISHAMPKYNPPSREFIESTMEQFKIPQCRNQMPFYGEPQHVKSAIDVGFNCLKIPAKNAFEEFASSFPTLREYQKQFAGNVCKGDKEFTTLKLSYSSNKSCYMRPAKKPPSIREIKQWLQCKEDKTCKPQPLHEVKDHEYNEEFILAGRSESICEDVFSLSGNKSSWENSHGISGVSLNNTHGFKMTLDNLQEARSLDIYQYITSLTMELHADTRGDLHPDPQLDAIRAIFFALSDDIPDASDNEASYCSPEIFTSGSSTSPGKDKFIKGFICVSPGFMENTSPSILTGTGIELTKYTFIVPDEQSLFKKFFELFHEWNPDILMGYEIEQSSWGYLVERGYVLELNVPSILSRIRNEKKISATSDNESEELHAHLKITGRIVLDLWRILKHEIALQSYTFENLAYHVLHERIPHYSFKDLARWWSHVSPKYRHRTVTYYLYRVEGAFRILDHYDLIGRTAELARLFGILFYEVLSRGSQFRVESMMLRLAKPQKFIPVSPNVQQKARMKAPEFLPLILEPESKFYKDPVIVLDFQSLYPSIIIAYNYCFSTCLGRVEHLASNEPFEFGAYELEVSRKLVAHYLRRNMLNISPCGVAFVKSDVRAGIMPRMLREILDTRLMVKKSMKKHKSNKTLQKVLHSRQLGLKLIANVTYGYTAANFSGRMPAVEVGDSVVAKGRETLQRAIAMIENNPSWGARVVYGDTDSMFVLCEGKSRAETFKIGEEIAEAVTNANPSPVRLKLEKVYQPCILQTKKRYVGYMYESPEQETPEFEAKGIETVRRDGCPAASKMLQKCLRLLFDSRDVSLVRNYVVKQFNKILTGRVSIQDLTFAKEYRGRGGYRPGACVPALELTRKWITTDKRKEPRSGERVPYVIINGPPGLPLIKLVKSPHDLLNDCALRPNALYYITKAIIPPVNRCFKLIGADLFTWFDEMPRKQVQHLRTGSPQKGPKATISQYFATTACAACSNQSRNGLCDECQAKPQDALAVLYSKMRLWERRNYTCKKVCESCCVRSIDLTCNSLDCPVLYRVKQTNRDLEQADFVRSLIEDLF